MNAIDVIEEYRAAVLRALDITTRDLFRKNSACGWQDQDLPALFKTIDSHVMTLAKRHEIELEDEA